MTILYNKYLVSFQCIIINMLIEWSFHTCNREAGVNVHFIRDSCLMQTTVLNS